MNREFLMLGQPFKDQPLDNMFASIKYDGQRCLWDGGISRGKPKALIPWANQAKDQRYKERQIATGLWSRYGNVIHAPDWFIDKLPPMFLDGELYWDRGMFQETRSIIADISPGAGWQNIRYLVFDKPPPQIVLQTGKINNVNMKMFIDGNNCASWYRSTVVKPFSEVYQDLQSLHENDVLQIVKQTRVASKEQLFDMLDLEDSLGGEGIMLRAANSIWLPKRSKDLLKIKKFLEDSGVIVGLCPGLGKYSGMLGAVTVSWNSIEFNLSGFTDEERILSNERFKIGESIRFKYRELTDGGIPREARYWR